MTKPSKALKGTVLIGPGAKLYDNGAWAYLGLIKTHSGNVSPERQKAIVLKELTKASGQKALDCDMSDIRVERTGGTIGPWVLHGAVFQIIWENDKTK
jgi:hypothetical protein